MGGKSSKEQPQDPDNLGQAAEQQAPPVQEPGGNNHESADPGNNRLPRPHGTHRVNRLKRKRNKDEGHHDFAKKKRLGTTSRHIYEKLFIQGRDSDITIKAFEREWKLHKVHLEQSPYFATMFSGQWSESSKNVIEISVTDPEITLKSFDIALGSFYQDLVSIKPTEAVSVIAAATYLQIEGLFEQCVQVLRESITGQTVSRYMLVAEQYGARELLQDCKLWFRVNLLSHMTENPSFLKKISPDLMLSILSTPDLFVIQTEFSLYVLLRVWVYFHFVQPRGNKERVFEESNKYFVNRSKGGPAFLSTPEGDPYVPIFRKLHLDHVVNHHLDMDMLLKERIVPDSWMYPVYRRQWRSMLLIDQRSDLGPRHLTEEQFDRNCFRCGKVLTDEGRLQVWRWTGFKMGLDLVVSFDNNNFTLVVQRNLGSTPNSTGLVCQLPRRSIYYKVAVASVNKQPHDVYVVESGLKCVVLGKDSKHKLLQVDASRLPMNLSFNFCVSTPNEEPLEEPDNELQQFVEQPHEEPANELPEIVEQSEKQ